MKDRVRNNIDIISKLDFDKLIDDELSGFLKDKYAVMEIMVHILREIDELKLKILREG